MSWLEREKISYYDLKCLFEYIDEELYKAATPTMLMQLIYHYPSIEIKIHPLKCDTNEKEFTDGEFPQLHVSNELNDILNKLLKEGKLQETGKEYSKFIMDKKIKEYIYEGKKYALASTKWLKVEPIVWQPIGDGELAIAKKILLFGKTYEELADYLNNEFLEEITPSNLNSRIAKSPTPKKTSSRKKTKTPSSNETEQNETKQSNQSPQKKDHKPQKRIQALKQIKQKLEQSPQTSNETIQTEEQDISTSNNNNELITIETLYEVDEWIIEYKRKTNPSLRVKPENVKFQYLLNAYKKSEKIHPIINSTNKTNFKFGEYPQVLVSEMQNDILNKLLEEGNLQETGKEYSKFIMGKKIKEYIYEGKKYALASTKWLKVEPIVWQPIGNGKLAIAKNIALLGNTYEELADYLSNEFLEEITPSNLNSKIAKSPTPKKTSSRKKTPSSNETEQNETKQSNQPPQKEESQVKKRTRALKQIKQNLEQSPQTSNEITQTEEQDISSPNETMHGETQQEDPKKTAYQSYLEALSEYIIDLTARSEPTKKMRR